MLAATELRIGNIVKLIGETWSEPVRNSYHQITGQDIVDIEAGHSEGYEPIPINDETLALCGFVRSKNSIYIWKIKEVHGFSVERRASRYYLREYKVDRNGMKYLHELQNLFYAIVGEELKIELTAVPRITIDEEQNS